MHTTQGRAGCLLLTVACLVACAKNDGRLPTGTAGASDSPATPVGAAGATGSSAVTQAPALTLESAMQQYKGWTQHTPEPTQISAAIFALCRTPTASEQAFTESEHGKIEYALLDFLNEGALRGVETRQSQFPVGAAIVKEKLKSGASGRLEVAALGFMIKQPRGFATASGDWQFGYWEPTRGLLASAADVGSCVQCHASSATDHVFLDDRWRQPSP